MWREDLRYLARELPRRHPNLYFRVPRTVFEDAASALDARIPSLASHQIVVEFARIVAMAGDGHTLLLLPQPASGFRRHAVRLRSFREGLHVTWAPAGYAHIIGTRVVQIGNMTVDDARRRVAAIVSRDSDWALPHWVPRYLTIAEVLHALGISERRDEVRLVLAGPGDGRIEYTAGIDENPAGASRRPGHNQAPACPLAEKHSDIAYWFEYLPGDRILYVNYSSCSNRADVPFDEFAREVFSATAAQPVDRLLLDLRQNGGGNSSLFRPFLRAIGRHDELNRPGRLFVAVGPATASSGLWAAIDMRRHTRAALVGQPTGGRPNAYGDARSFLLPNSKLSVTHSTKYWHRLREDTPALMPDLWIEPAASDFFAGRDTVLERIRDIPTG